MKHELCKLAAVPASGSRVVPFFGREVHVYRAGGEICAVANVCLHFGGPLECRDGKLTCPWHGASFDMGSGRRTDGPAPRESKLMRLSTRVEGDSLFYIWDED
jgi:nitrite reductase/ring-hydroxylating ferredoxin subunit